MVNGELSKLFVIAVYGWNQNLTEGMPSIKRTEASLSKKKRGDKLWEGAKEKLIGERGINESFD
jgi:hypothetical protein